MAKRKTSRAKKSKSSVKAKKKAAAPKKSAARKRSARAKRPTAARRAARRPRRSRVRPGIGGNAGPITLPDRPGFGPSAAGQAGDIEDLPDTATVDSESVEELAAEGQDFEAEVVDAVQNAPDPDESEVKTRELPEDEVPEEYEDDQKPGRFTR